MIPLFATLFFLGMTSAARFGLYLDGECRQSVTKSIAFTDVCTWSSNVISGSYAMYLSACTESELELNLFNLTGQAGCNGIPVNTLSLNSTCAPHGDLFVKALDFTCLSQNTSYNLLGHFTPGCEDGGYAFSIQLGGGQCEEDSFGPGLWNWDARGNYSEPFYQLELFNTTNGSCEDETAIFQTKTFPAWCLPSGNAFQNISIDIYSSFPVSSDSRNFV